MKQQIKKVCYVPWLGSPKNNIVFDNNVGNWEYQLARQLEQENIKIDTDDLVSMNQVDAAITFDNIFYKNLDAIWEMYDNHILHNCIYIDYEPPTGHCKNHSLEGLRRLSRIFKKVITYNDDLVDGKRIIKGNIANFYSKNLKYKHDFKSRKFITMITNNTGVENIVGILNSCNASNYFNEKNTPMHPNSLYSKREEAAHYFLKKCPFDFDLYGTLWGKEFLPVLRGYVDKDKKCKTLSQYKFIISYDSFCNQNGYISEKIFDAFRAKVVPIYWGADNVTDYIPKECFIDKRDFNTYDDLYDYLRNMTEEEYDKRIEAIETYLKSDIYRNHFSSEASATIIKNALLSEVDDFSYEEAYRELMYFQRKRDKVEAKRKINFYASELSENGKMVEFIFFIVDYTKKKNPSYEPYVNGKKAKKYQSIVNKQEGYIEYQFRIKIKWKYHPVEIQIRYKDDKQNHWLDLADVGKSASHEYGICVLHNNKTIRYYNYVGGSKIDRLRFLLHDREKLYHKMRQKLSDNKYRIVTSITRKKNEIIGRNRIVARIYTIGYRLIKLPFLYIKDIIDVFKWEN